MNAMSDLGLTQNLELPPVIGEARLVLMPIGRLYKEMIAIAVVGRLNDGTPFARPVTSKVLKCLPNELGQTCFTFGTLVAEDFMAWLSSAHSLTGWTSPLSGLEVSDVFPVDGYDLDDVVKSALGVCALHADIAGEDLPEKAKAIPRTADEARFLESVRQEVIRSRPALSGGFKRSFSLTGQSSGSEIDFVGSRYATCYAAINPKSNAGARVKTAAAALWRLARARDVFGFAAPAQFELTAWTPPIGLPIYSDAEYETVRTTVAELREQARREDLFVFPAFDSTMATSRLLEVETEQLSS